MSKINQILKNKLASELSREEEELVRIVTALARAFQCRETLEANVLEGLKITVRREASLGAVSLL